MGSTVLFLMRMIPTAKFAPPPRGSALFNWGWNSPLSTAIITFEWQKFWMKSCYSSPPPLSLSSLSLTVILPLCDRKYELVEDRLFEITLVGDQCHKASATPITDRIMAPSFLNIWQISASLISERIGSIGEGVCKKAVLQGIPVCKGTKEELVLRQSCFYMKLVYSPHKLSHESMCFMLGIQNDRIPYCLVLNLYTINGISITVHDLICITCWIDTSKRDLTSIQASLCYFEQYCMAAGNKGDRCSRSCSWTWHHTCFNVVFYCNYDFL